MNPFPAVSPHLRSVFAALANGSLSVDQVLETVVRWEQDMEAREREAIRVNRETGDHLLMATRARGMHLGALSLGVRLELLLAGSTLESSVRH